MHRDVDEITGANGSASSALSNRGAATQRNETARLRDATASSRDLAAGRRDRTAEQHQEALLVSDDERETVRALLLAGAAAREHAADDRASAARDRYLAAQDRAASSADCIEAQLELELAHLDSLTGALSRNLGRVTLQHEIERSRRSGEPWALAFIDVDGLKELNDREGHAAGDVLLQTVVLALKDELRSYDPIVRLGGDEFLCGFTNTGLRLPGAGSSRFVSSSHRGRAEPPSASVSPCSVTATL